MVVKGWARGRRCGQGTWRPRTTSEMHFIPGTVDLPRSFKPMCFAFIGGCSLLKGWVNGWMDR